MLGAPAQEALGRSLYAPTNRNATFPPDQRPRLILGEAAVDAIGELPWADILPQRDTILDRWNREIGA